LSVVIVGIIQRKPVLTHASIISAVGLKSDGTTGHLEVDTPRATVPSHRCLRATDTRRDTGPWHCSSNGTHDETFNCPSLCGLSSHF